jgi:hypothetical protein
MSLVVERQSARESRYQRGRERIEGLFFLRFLFSVSLFKHATTVLFSLSPSDSTSRKNSPVLGLLDQGAGEGARVRSSRAGQDAGGRRVLRRARRDAGEQVRARGRRDHRRSGRAAGLTRGVLLPRGVSRLGSEAREHFFDF